MDLACALVPSVQLITNGSHITPAVAARFKAAGLRSVQLTLLSAERDRHDALKGAVCFDDTVRAALDLRDAGVPVQVCFVAMAENWQDFEGVLELCYVLGVRSVSYNRMSPTGWAIHQLDRLLPLVEQVEQNLDTAERLGRAWGIRVATAMPIPPCLIRLDRYAWVQFGFCSIGSSSPNLTVDALGNVRSCNLSANILGNITQQDWATIHAQPYLHTFKAQVPAVCRGCAYEASCQGGCKESGHATFGDLRHPEPFLWQGLHGEAPTPALVTIGEPTRR
ncbi:MAG: radical SAM protein [bacterium]